MGSPGAGSSGGGGGGHECSFKILLIGDSGVGKSSLLVSFVVAAAAAHLDDDIAPTIGTYVRAPPHHSRTDAAHRSPS
jgi:Ras-related protein Rab-18